MKKQDYQHYRFSKKEALLSVAAGSAIGLAVCWICYHDLRSIPLAALIAFIYVRQKKQELAQTKRKQLLFHFKDFVLSLHTAMHAGASLERAIEPAYRDLVRLYGAEDAMTKEAGKIKRDLEIMIPVEKSLSDLGKRSDVDEIIVFAEMIATVKRTGGDLNRLLEDSRRTICEKIETEKEIERQLSAKKTELKIMILMPACIILYLRLTFSGFIEKMYGNAQGVLIMSACLIVYGFAIWLGKKIVHIEV